MVVLPTPGPPVMTSTLEIRASRIAVLWLSASCRPDALLDPGQGLVRIDPRPGKLAVTEPDQSVSDAALGPIEARQKHARRFTDPIGDHGALGELQIEGRADQLLRHLEQLLGERDQFIGRQSAMTLVHGFGERIGDAGAHPDHGGLLDAEFHGNRVGGLEADAADIARQAIGVLRHHLHGVGAVGLVDTHRPRRADAMLVQEHHDLAHDLLLGPGVRDALGAAPDRCPVTSRRRSGSASIMSKTFSPKARTSFLA